MIFNRREEYNLLEKISKIQKSPKNQYFSIKPLQPMKKPYAIHFLIFISNSSLQNIYYGLLLKNDKKIQ